LRVLFLAAFLAFVAATCGGTDPTAFAPDTVLVVVNRTATPIAFSFGTVEACTEVSYTRQALDAGVSELVNSDDPSVPAGTVDYTNVSFTKAVGEPGPIVVVVTASGNKYSTSLDRSTLGACVGRAQPVS
jgi:hypothetical protein